MELLLLCVLLVFAAGVTPIQGGFLNLHKIIKQVTKKTPISYWSYGCHCGLGGKGPPLDPTDWCCHAHDCCYYHLKLHKCHWQIDHYNYTFSQGAIECSDRGSWCEQQLCACDKEVAYCLLRHLGTYKKKLRFAGLFRSRCKGSTPTC